MKESVKQGLARLFWQLRHCILWIVIYSCPAADETASKLILADEASIQEIQSLVQKGSALTKNGEETEAIQVWEVALAKSIKAVGEEDSIVAALQRALGSLYQSQADYTKAFQLYRNSLATREKIFGPDHAEVANSLNGLASLFRELGNNTKPLSLESL